MYAGSAWTRRKASAAPLIVPATSGVMTVVGAAGRPQNGGQLAGSNSTSALTVGS
jgi:hypothetical protein